MQASRNRSITILCSLVFLYAFSGKMLLMPLLPAIEKDFALTHTKASILWTAFVITYAVMQLLVDKIIRSFGRKRTLVFATVFYSFTILATSLIKSYQAFLVFQVIAAIPNGIFFLTGLSLVDEMREDRRGGLYFSLFVSAGALGYMVSSLIASLALRMGDWHWGYGLWFPLGLILAAMLWIWLPAEHNEYFRPARAKATVETARSRGMFRYILVFPYLLILVVYLLNTARLFSNNAFISSYLVFERGISKEATALYYTIMMCAGFLGQLSGRLIGDRLGNAWTQIGALSLTAVLTFLQTRPSSFAEVMVIAVLIQFVANLCYPLTVQMLMSLVPDRVRTSTMGVANALSFVASGVGPVIIGRVIDTSGFMAGYSGVAIIAAGSLVLITIAASFWSRIRRNAELTAAEK